MDELEKQLTRIEKPVAKILDAVPERKIIYGIVRR